MMLILLCCILGLTASALGQQCQADTCLNQGVCVIVQGSASCACPPGVTGDRCQNAGTTAAPVPDVCENDPCLNGGICTPGGASFICTCQNGFAGTVCQVAATAAPTTTPAPVCDASDVFNGCEKADVIFMVTYSRYDDSDDIDHEGDYLKGLIGEFKVDPDHVRVGVVVYHDTVTEAIHLDDYQNDEAGLINRIEVLTAGRRQNGLLQPSGQAMYSKALQYVKDVSFQRARPDAKRVVISIVHRLPDVSDYDAIYQTATELKADCTQLFVEAVARDRYEGYGYNGQTTSLLQQVATTPNAPYYFKYSSFVDMENAAQRFNINCPASRK